MTTTRPMFPHVWDSSMLAAFASCPQKCFRSYVEHWKPKNESVHLVAGGAFAAGIEAARKAYFDGEGCPDPSISPKGNAELSQALGAQALLKAYGDFECPAESAKSLERTLGALEFYFDNYQLGADGLEPLLRGDRHAIEYSFAEPIGVNHPVSGDPLLYAGRLDCLGVFGGGVYGVDEKTTSSLGASWSRQWDMRAQFSGYQWACGQQGISLQGTIIRGISILKTKYDTQQVISTRGSHEIDLWLKQTRRNLQRAIDMWREGFWDFNLNGACAEYGGCSMTTICKSPSPDSWLPMYFEQRVWDPLARKEWTLAEWEASWQNPALITNE